MRETEHVRKRVRGHTGITSHGLWWRWTLTSIGGCSSVIGKSQETKFDSETISRHTFHGAQTRLRCRSKSTVFCGVLVMPSFTFTMSAKAFDQHRKWPTFAFTFVLTFVFTFHVWSYPVYKYIKFPAKKRRRYGIIKCSSNIQHCFHLVFPSTKEQDMERGGAPLKEKKQTFSKSRQKTSYAGSMISRHAH